MVTFEVVLTSPVVSGDSKGGGSASLGPQYRANVTIVNASERRTDPTAFQWTPALHNSTVQAGVLTVIAGEEFDLSFQAYSYLNLTQTTGGDAYISIIYHYSVPDTGALSAGGSRRQVKLATITDLNSGIYNLTSSLIYQGSYSLHTYYLYPSTLRAEYYSDAFFQNRAGIQNDRLIDYNWGSGRIALAGTNYVSVRWTGVLQSNYTGEHLVRIMTLDQVRMWLNGVLVLDHTNSIYAGAEAPRKVSLIAYAYNDIVVEYRHLSGNDAYISLQWSYGGGNFTAIQPHHFYSLYELTRISPLTIRVISAAASANTTTLVMLGQSLTPTVLKPHAFSVCPRDVYGNLRNDNDVYYMSTEAFGAAATLVNDLGYDGQGAEVLQYSVVYNVDSHCFDMSSVAMRAGVYRYDIYYYSNRDGAPQAIKGSPFYLKATPSYTYGPYSQVVILTQPLYLTAGQCMSFTVVARDGAHNLKLTGGDDIEVSRYVKLIIKFVLVYSTGLACVSYVYIYASVSNAIIYM